MGRSAYYGNRFSEYVHNRTPLTLPEDILEPEPIVGMADMGFMEDGLCRQTDPDVFFPDPENQYRSSKEAKKICQRCPVREECLEYAVTAKIVSVHGYDLGYVTGVWGGTTNKQRAKIRTERGITTWYGAIHERDERGMITANVYTEGGLDVEPIQERSAE